MAEADGNRTRRRRVATSPIGFEVRGGHQARNRFQRRFYSVFAGGVSVTARPRRNATRMDGVLGPAEMEE